MITTITCTPAIKESKLRGSVIKLDARKVEFILLEMGITDQHVYAVRAASTQELADFHLAKFRDLFRVGYRRLVKEWHPDHNGGDLRKTELFRILTDLRVWVNELKVTIQAPPVPKEVTIHYYPHPTPKVSKVDPKDTAKTIAELQPKFAWVRVK